MTSWLDMANAVRDRFNTHITVALSLPTQFDNENFEPPDNDVWCRFTLLPAATDQLELGQPATFRTLGRAMALIFLPLATGDVVALSLADSISAAFRSLTAAGVTYFSPSVTQVGRSGSWWQLNVDIPFYVEDLG